MAPVRRRKGGRGLRSDGRTNLFRVCRRPELGSGPVWLLRNARHTYTDPCRDTGLGVTAGVRKGAGGGTRRRTSVLGSRWSSVPTHAPSPANHIKCDSCQLLRARIGRPRRVMTGESFTPITNGRRVWYPAEGPPETNEGPAIPGHGGRRTVTAKVSHMESWRGLGRARRLAVTQACRRAQAPGGVIPDRHVRHAAKWPSGTGSPT